MSDRTHDATSGAGSSALPLDILPIGSSILLFLALTAVVVHRICHNRDAHARRLARSRFLLFSGREPNRQRLDGLEGVKEPGLGRLQNGKRVCSMDLEVRSREERNFEDDAVLFRLLALPQRVFFPNRPPLSPSCTISRRPWIQNLFRRGRIPLLGSETKDPRGFQFVPEIRITVPSTAANRATPLLPQYHKWSKTIEHDIDLAISGMLDLRAQAEAAETYTPTPPSAPEGTITTTFRYPPSSIHTLPGPARRRLASVPHMTVDLRTCQDHGLYMPLSALSPISESRESCCSSARSRLMMVCDTVVEDKNGSVKSALISETQSDLLVAGDLAQPRPSHSLPSIASDSSGPRLSGCPSCSESMSNYSQVAASVVDSISAVSQGSLASTNQPLAMASEISFGLSLTAIPTSPAVPTSPALPASPVAKFPCYSPTTLATSIADSPPTPFTPNSRYLCACSPDAPDLDSASYTTSSASINPYSIPSPIPTSLVPSAYTCATMPLSTSSIANNLSTPFAGPPFSLYYTKLGEPDSARDSACDNVNRLKGQNSFHDLTDIELWVDEDVDLFYCPGPV